MADLTGLRICYLGNFEPDHSTENEVRRAFDHLGATVVTIQEGTVPAVDVPGIAADADLFLWTQTYGLAETGGTNEQRLGMLDAIRAAGVPTVGFHLDRWFGLAREGQVDRDAFFRVDRLFTADGGHQDQWAERGINHSWLPPAVSEFECEPALKDVRFDHDVVFVGNWRGTYHPEWRHRRDLIRMLRRTYRGRLRLYPQPGEGAVRGEALRRLYATASVVVGDSCLVGDRGRPYATRYISDRVPETLGRAGFLIHPNVEGVTDGTHYVDGQHLRTFDLFDWPRLADLIGHYLEHPAARDEIAEAGREHVLANHTYTVRARQVVEDLTEHGML